MNQSDWKSMGDNRKVISRILTMPAYNSNITFEKRTVFLCYGDWMVKTEQLSAEDLEIIKDVFIRWEKSLCKKPKQFALSHLNKKEVDLLLSVWEKFQQCIQKFQSNYTEESAQA